jgi:L-fucose/D-arabinose isomerase
MPRVGVVCVSDVDTVGFDRERELKMRELHNQLITSLAASGCTPVDPMPLLRETDEGVFGVRLRAELQRCVDYLLQQRAECLVIECYFWTPPMVVVQLARDTHLPVLLFTTDMPKWPGTSCITSAGGALLESGVTSHALTHERLKGDYDGVAVWARGVTAIEKMKRCSALLWGGTYSVKMEQAQDDLPRLKSFFIGDVLSEDQSMLLSRTHKILEKHPERVDRFVAWLKDFGTTILFDEKRFTPSVLRTQLAYVLAARDRLEELADENVQGVSIKCDPELRTDYGVTPCTLPAFLPFASDCEGQRDVIPTVCEGDIKALLTMMLLQKVNPSVPPMFGDIMLLSEMGIYVSNCGGAPVYWAANSFDPAKVLPCLTIEANCEGESGGSVGFRSRPGPVTVARLMRVRGEYWMTMGVGESLALEGEVLRWADNAYGLMYPRTAFRLGSSASNLLRVVGGNHLAATRGDCSREMTYACHEVGIPVLRIDSDRAIQDFREEYLTSRARQW